jgi:uroporphyrinogen-III synthase
MSRKDKSKPDQPLKGIRILVGRARHQAGSLSGQLRMLGAQVLEIPFIEIRKPRSFRLLDDALKNLSAYDWLILTSVNGVDAMWARFENLKRKLPSVQLWKSGFSGPRQQGLKDEASAPAVNFPHIAAIGPATQKAIEERGLKVNIVPKEYVAESVVRALKKKVKGKRVLLVRAKVARDVIPRELRRAGARVDVVEAYETVIPESSRTRLRAALNHSRRRPHIVTFTSSSTVKNFSALLGGRTTKSRSQLLNGILMASIGPITSSTLRDLGLPVDIAAKEFTIPGLISAIVTAIQSTK